MIVVLDTNVIISVLLKADSIPHTILDAVIARKVTLCYTYEILREYTAVLNRDVFSAHIPREAVRAFLEFITYECFSVAPAGYDRDIPDRSDLPFIEACLGAKADYLITGNKKHFPKMIGKTRVISPKEYMLIDFRS